MRAKTPVARAAANDPAILSVGAIATGGADTYDVSVGGGVPGTVTFTVYDASDHEVDHVAVSVSSTATIAVDGGAQDGLTILTGEAFALHVTSLGAHGETLAGAGAIHFDYAGSIRADSSLSFCLGDCAQFRADMPGDGAVLLAATGAARTLNVHAIATTAIDALAFSAATLDVAAGATAEVEYTLSAKGALVHGRALQCVGSMPAVATFTDDGPLALGMAATGRLSVVGVAAGTTSVACTANGKAASVAVRVR